MHRRHQCWGLVVILVASAAAAPVSVGVATANSGIETETQSLPTVDSHATVELLDSSGDTKEVRVTIRYENYTGTDPYAISVFDKSNVDHVKGFEYKSRGTSDTKFYWWDGETETPVIEYTLQTHPSWYTHEDIMLENIRTEHFYGRPFYVRAGEGHLIGNFEYSTAGPGGHAGDVIFFGEATVERHSIGNTTVPFVVPASLDQEVNTETAARAMAHTHRALNLTDDVHLKAVWYTNEISAPGVEIFNHIKLKPSATANTARHEYIHTQQHFGGPNLGWFSEGSADYLASLAAVLDGNRTLDKFYLDANTTIDSEANLLEYEDDDAHYTKGERIVAAMDARIRDETDGEASVVDLVRALNRRNPKNASKPAIDYLFDELERLTTTNTSEQIRPHLTEPTVPDLPSQEKFRRLVSASRPDSTLISHSKWDVSANSDATGDGEGFINNWLLSATLLGIFVVLAVFFVASIRLEND